MQPNNKPNQQKPKREFTLKELMTMQGKLPKHPQPPKESAPQRTEAEKKRQASELAEKLSGQMAAKPAGKTKEDKLKEMIESDPEKAAEILRNMFLKK